jgi:TP901 family phage tail tape measure protein
MVEDLKIKIIGSLDSKKTTDSMQSQLNEIEKKLNIQIGVDTKMIENLGKQINQIQQTVTQQSKGIKIINDKEIIKNLDNVQNKVNQTFTSVEKAVKEYSKFGTVKVDTKLDPITKEVQNFTLNVKKADDTIEKMKFNLANIDTGKGIQKIFERTDLKNVDNTQAQREKALQSEHQLRQKVQQDTIKNQNELRKKEESYVNWFLKSVKEREIQHNKSYESMKNKLELYQKNAGIDANKLSQTHSRTVDGNALSEWQKSVSRLNADTPDLNNKLKHLSLEFKNIKANASEAARSSMSFGDMMSQAMIKFPIWMLSATMFYAPLRALQDMSTRLIEIDTLMVDLQRVMDAPDYKFVDMLDQAVNASDELSSKLTDVLAIMGDFARMGFEENELMDISKTAQVLQNISDLDAKGSVDTLTSAMLNFNIAAEDSISIADKLNEVDNNFAVSTKDLSDGLRKSASTAKTFGVEIDELIGYIAAIGSTTRESGNIIGNGLKTIFSRVTTMSDAEGALNAVNISIKDLGGSVRPVSDILGELAGKWGTLSEEQQQQTAVSLAGRYQLSRFLALMNNFSLSQDATSTSLNSTNSAMTEQAKYADSLEGRINRLDTAWNKLTLSTGDAFLTDGLIAAIESLNDIANVTSVVVDKIGVLSGVFGTAGVAIFALSTKVRTFTTAMLFGSQAVSTTAASTVGLTAVMNRATIATIGFSGALRGLMSATIIGGAFVILGFAIEKLIGAYAKAKQEQEEFEQAQNQNVDALTKNKGKTNELIESYKELSEQKNNGAWDSEKEKEYLRIQNEIANVYPALIDHIDSTGQAHIRTSSEIEKEIELTNKLIEAKKEELKVKAQDNIQKEIDKQKELKEELKDLKNQRDGFKDFKGTVGSNDDELEKRVKEWETKIVGLEIKVSGASAKINEEILKISDAYTKLEINPSIEKSVDSLVSSMDFSKMDASEIEGFSIEFAKLKDSMQKAFESGDASSFDKATTELRDFLESSGATEVQLDGLELSYEKVDETTKALASSTYDGSDGMDEMSDSIDGVTESADKLLKSYETAVDNISELNGIQNELNEGYGISGETIGTIMEKYPDLLGYINDESALREQITKKIEEEENVALDAMTKKLEGNEQYFNQVLKGNDELIKSLAKAYDIDIKNTKSMAQLKAQINSKLMQKLGSDWADYYDAQSMAFTESGRKMLETMSYQEAINSPQLKAIGDYQVQMNKLSESLRNVTSEFTGGNIALEGLDTKTKDSAKENENATYIADKYKESLEKVNLELEKQNKIQAQFPDYSKDYQNSLKKEIDLLTQKKDILNAQRKEMEKQIKAGKVQQTGVVTSKSSISTSGSGSSYKGNLLNKPLTQQTSVSASDLNKWINSKAGKSSVMYNSGDAFIRAAAESGLDPLYLVAHAAHETGWGNSNIAKSKNNFFGIGAFDSSPYASAYNYNGATAGIVEGSKWISKNYANGRYGQDTLSKMRFNNGVHQYATDPGWADKIASIMSGSGYTSNATGSITASGSSSKDYAQQLSDVDSAKLDVLGLKQEMLDIDSQLSQLQLDIINSEVAKYDHMKSQLSDDFAKIDRQMSMETETSKKWVDLQLKKESLINKEVEYQQKSIDYIKNQIKNNKELSKAQKMLLEDQLIDRTTELYSLEMKILDERKTMADTILDTYKKAAEAQKDASLKVIDDMLTEMDKEIADADYKKRLRDQQKDRQGILDEMASLSLDNSDSAKKKLSELKDQLLEMDDSLSEMQDDRAIDFRKEALNQRKEDITSNYENLVNDEKRFADMRSNIINGNIKDISKTLNGYFVNIKSNSEALGQALSSNLINLINQANSYLGGKDFKPVKVAQAREGGILPSWGSSGKMMYVHENEMISNKHDTKNLIKSFSMADELIDKIRVALPKLPSILGGNNVTGGNTYNLSLNVDTLTGTKEDAGFMLSEIVKGVKILGGDI